MKKIIAVVIGTVVACGLGLTLGAARYEPVIRPNVKIGMVAVGGLSREEAAKKLRLWWEGERRTLIRLTSDKLDAQPPEMSVSSYGMGLDDAKSIAQLPMNDFWDSAEQKIGLQSAVPKTLQPVYTFDESKIASLKRWIKKKNPPGTVAKAFYRNGAVVRQRESSSIAIDTSRVRQAVLDAMGADGSGELPLNQGSKHVSDEALGRIEGIVASFSTRFPTRKVSRCGNIKLASHKLDGVVVMPGERFSFNQTVGRRTIEDGYREAGVYKNGKHDTGVGGGICQVSTTLYNALLLSNLKIKERSNHSLPVAYVPMGRDATVDYGSHDLAFENDQSTPVAISSKYEPGRLTFYVLGKPQPELKVKIELVGRRTWALGAQTVIDRSLPAGRKKIVDKGGIGGSVTTYRVVYRDGVQASRQLISHSYYRGGPKIIAVNPAAPAPPVSAEPPPPVLPPQ